MILVNLSERIKFLSTKEGIISFQPGEEKEVDAKIFNSKKLPNSLVIKETKVEEKEEVVNKEPEQKVDAQEDKQLEKSEQDSKGDVENKEPSEDLDKKEPQEPEKAGQDEEKSEDVKEADKEPEEKVNAEEDLIKEEIESLKTKLQSVTGKRQKEVISNKIAELEDKLKK